MIEVEYLTKRYGLLVAIEDVSFQVRQGEILGFLGPNGAGKTTTMRILAGFFPATQGRAMVAGYDVFEHPLEAKSRVGYLPESPPLYTEMTVDSYLRFVATIKGVAGSETPARMEVVKERCGLSGQGERLIKHLSKGFRQRVGLAQALIHDPDVLILDEPTIGLDPKQIIEFRELIGSLRGEHTIILSTHILPEVSMTCDRVIIINRGQIVAVDSPRNLTSQMQGGEQIDLTVGGDTGRVAELLNALPHVRRVAVEEPQNGLSSVLVEADGQAEIRHEVARQVIREGLDLYELKVRSVSLEEVFVELTTEEETAAGTLRKGADPEQEGEAAS